MRTCTLLAVMLFLPAITTLAATETVIWNFNASDGQPNFPYNNSLLRDRSGNLFGVTAEGGTYNAGAVFEVSPALNGGWTRQVLYSFPQALHTALTGGVVKDEAGHLYGVSSEGGTNDSGFVYGLSPNSAGIWKLEVLHSFAPCCGDVADGISPSAGLAIDSKANLYGTTLSGGAGGFGTIYELSRGSNGEWTEMVLFSFTDYNVEGGYPEGSLLIDPSGNLYGTAAQGGLLACGVGCGTVFELVRGKAAWDFKVLHRFNYTDGEYPRYVAPAMDAGGNLYGATEGGGAYQAGVIWKLLYSAATNTYTETVLHNFGSSPDDGSGPLQGVTLDAQGNVYGATMSGGLYSAGTVYKLTYSKLLAGWTETVLYPFMGANDGGYPSGGVVLEGASDLYGLAAGGGAFGDGAIYKITP